MALRIARIAGIPISIHGTFWIVPALVAVSAWSDGGGGARVVSSIAFVLAIFASVVAHELGHAFAARRYGIPTRSITLYPIGGIAELARMPERPRHELVIAIAGPAVNVAIAALLWFGLLATGSMPPWPVDDLSRAFAPSLLAANLLLAGFNLLPAFPMDGGRVLRALLASRYTHAWATRVAARVGQTMALLFAVGGLLWNPFLLLLAAFVWFSAAREAGMAIVQDALAGAPVMQAVSADVHSLRVDDRLGLAVELTLDTDQRHFPVVLDGAIVGLLTQGDLLRALATGGPDGLVGGAMRVSPPEVRADEPLDRALGLMAETGSPCLPVVEYGRTVGIVSRDNIGELIEFRRVFGGRLPTRVVSALAHSAERTDPMPGLVWRGPLGQN